MTRAELHKQKKLKKKSDILAETNHDTVDPNQYPQKDDSRTKVTQKSSKVDKILNKIIIVLILLIIILCIFIFNV